MDYLAMGGSLLLGPKGRKKAKEGEVMLRKVEARPE